MPIPANSPGTKSSFRDASRQLLSHTSLPGAGPLLEKALMLNRLDRLRVEAAQDAGRANFFEAMLERLKVDYRCADEDKARISREGPLILVVNHPFGLVEGPILGALLSAIRPDFKFLANSLLAEVPELSNYVIPVDPFGGEAAVRSNWRALRTAVSWLREKGLLVAFPAGEVSSMHFPRLQVQEPVWHDTIARVVSMTKAPVIPVHIHGSNSALFQIAGLVHPGLRTMLLPRELFNKQGWTIRLTVGHAIPASRLEPMGSQAAAEYLRERTQFLGSRFDAERANPSVAVRLTKPRHVPVAEAGDARAIQSEVEALPRRQTLAASGDSRVIVADAGQIPETLREIGRLREIAFRQAGEGTGAALDLDRFDRYYRHLFLWNEKRKEVCGAYRLAGTDSVLARFGVRGLYTSTLFRFKPGFLEDGVFPALELGRSFVRPEYQKSYQSLFLLWKGIGAIVAREPRYRYLLGPVSISNKYRPASRALMTAYLSARCRDERLAAGVEPVRKFRPRVSGGCDVTRLSTLLTDVDDLSQAISDLEPDRQGVPVLLRQYLNLGGQILDFNVDPRFSGVVDGLIVVDLLKLGKRLLGRYLGNEGAQAFLAWHGFEECEATSA